MEKTQLAALLVIFESLLVADFVVLGLEVSRKQMQSSTKFIVKFSPSVDQLGCGISPGNPFTAQQDCHRTEATFTEMGCDGGAVFWEQE